MLGLHELQVLVQFRPRAHHPHGAATQHVAGPHHHGVTDDVRQRSSGGGLRGHPTRGLRHTEPLAERVERVAVLRLVDGGGGCPPDGHAGLLESAR